MTLRARPGSANPGFAPDGRDRSADIHSDRTALRHVLERAYPLAKQLAEVLELEAASDVDVAAMTDEAKRIRRTIGGYLAELGAGDVVLDGPPCQDFSS